MPIRRVMSPKSLNLTIICGMRFSNRKSLFRGKMNKAPSGLKCGSSIKHRPRSAWTVILSTQDAKCPNLRKPEPTLVLEQKCCNHVFAFFGRQFAKVNKSDCKLLCRYSLSFKFHRKA